GPTRAGQREGAVTGRCSERAEQDAPHADVLAGGVQPHERRELEHAGEHPWERPATRSFDELPGDKAVAEDEAMGGLQRLVDLVRPIDAVVRECEPEP